MKLIDIVTKEFNELKSKIRNSQLDKVDLVKIYGLQYSIYRLLSLTLKKNKLEDIYLEDSSKIPTELATYYLYQDVVDDPSNLNVSIQEKIEYSLQNFIDKYCIKKVEEKENV